MMSMPFLSPCRASTSKWTDLAIGNNDPALGHFFSIDRFQDDSIAPDDVEYLIVSEKDVLAVVDMVAAARGGDVNQAMDGEGDPKSASMEQALYWRQIYREVLAMEEKVMERIQDLMTKQSPQARREVELTNVPVVAAQAERFRQRLGFWTARVRELE